MRLCGTQAWVLVLGLSAAVVMPSACTRPPAEVDDVEDGEADDSGAADAAKAVGDDFDTDGDCELGERHCFEGKIWSCKNSGKGYKSSNCPSYKPICVIDKCLKCVPKTLSCQDPPTPGGVSWTVLSCDDLGKKLAPVETCQNDEVCFEGACVTCNPGAVGCDETKTRRCLPDGSAWEVLEDCAARSLVCVVDVCDTACPVGHDPDGHFGCEFWAVDLDLPGASPDRGFDAQAAPLGVLVANPGKKSALLRITADGVGQGGPKEQIWQVPAKSSKTFELPPKNWGMGHQSVDGSGVLRKAFRLRTSQPVAVWQLNPIAGKPLASAGGSLLLPTAGLGGAHWMVTHPQMVGSAAGPWRASATVVAASAGSTNVTVFINAPLLTGPDVTITTLNTSPIFALQNGDVLNLQTNGDGGDLSGMWVGSDKPIAVFGSNEATLAPATGNCAASAAVGKRCAGVDKVISCSEDSNCPTPCCADHIEGQLLQQDMWGKVWVGSRLARRGKEHDTWRVITGQGATLINLEPQVTKMIPQMDAGKFHDFETNKDFVLTSNVPVQLVRISAGAQATVTKIDASCVKDADCQAKHDFEGVCTGQAPNKICMPLGDPALLIEVPVAQFRQDYALAVPEGYVQRWLQLTAPKTATVSVNGNALPGSEWAAVAASEWKVARVAVKAGYHAVAADQPIGVLVYGWGPAVGFAWPGGVLGL